MRSSDVPTPKDPQQALQDAITDLQSRRAVLGDALVDAALAPLLERLAVNIAARLEQAAPAGTLRISQDTWALVRGLFDAQAQPPLAVKGVDAPLSSWLVSNPKPRAFRLHARGIRGQETPLIGRQAELARFEARSGPC